MHIYIYVHKEIGLSNFIGEQCNEIGAHPEVTYPAGCGRSDTYVTNIQNVHVAYQGLSTTTTKPTSHESRPTGRRLHNRTPQHPGSRNQDSVLACSLLSPSSCADHCVPKLPFDQRLTNQPWLSQTVEQCVCRHGT